MSRCTAVVCVLGLSAALGCSAFGGDPTSASSTPARPAFAAAPGSPLYVGPMAGRPVIADVNNDRKPDILVACGTCCGSKPDPKSGHIVVLLGRGDGSFDDAPGSPIKLASSIRKLAVADFNRDGKTDLAASEHDSYGITVMLGDGKGRFVPAPGSPFAGGAGARPHTHEVAAADVNGDGSPDLLSTNAADGTIGVQLGDGQGGFAPATQVRAARHPYDAIATTDLDRDGRLDIVVPDLAGHAVSALLGDGKGGFTAAPGSPIRVGERPGYVAVGDVNGDGAPDVFATHDDVGMVDVLLNDGKGGLKPAAGSPVLVRQAVWGVTVSEVNGDAHPDLVLGVFGRGEAGPVILLGDGKGAFTPAPDLGLVAGESPGYVTVGDLDGDGLGDLVTGNYGSGDVAVFLRARKK